MTNFPVTSIVLAALGIIGIGFGLGLAIVAFWLAVFGSTSAALAPSLLTLAALSIGSAVAFDLLARRRK